MAALYEFLDLRIDLDRRRVERLGTPVEVGGLTFDLLAYLLIRGDAVVSFDELIGGVWAPAVVGEETVTQRVKLLRQALGDDGRRPRYVRSVRGRGYQLCARPLARDPPPAPAQAPSPAAQPMRPVSSASAQRAIPTDEAHHSGTPLADQAARSGRSVAWLRFALIVAPLSLLAAAIAVWTLTSPRSPTLLALSPPSQSQLLERARYYASIGQRENNERAIALYGELARQNPQDIQAQLGLSFAYSARVCLYDFPAPWAATAESLARSAIRVQPRNGLAHAALAYSMDCRGLIDAAILAYERAAALGPDKPYNILASLANLYEAKGRLFDALKINLQLAREGAASRYLDIQIARDLDLLGFSAAAEARYSRTFQLYPDNVFSNISYPRFLMSHGRLAEAQAALDQALARNTDHVELFLLAGELALLRNHRTDAVRFFERARDLRPDCSLPATLATLYGAGLPGTPWARARIELLRRAIDSGDRWPVNWIEIAVLENAAGRNSAAVSALDRAMDAGFLDQAYLRASPLLQPLANDPGFAQVLERMAQRVSSQRRAVLESSWAPPALYLATAAP